MAITGAQMHAENPGDKWPELLADGALTVRAAVEFSGLSRTELFALMASDVLPWFAKGAKRTRFIPRKALVAVLVELARQADAERAKSKQKGKRK